MAGMEAASSPMTAVVVARDEETRILLRGLLRLRHFRILGEAEGSTHGTELVKAHQPRVLVVDANLAEGSASALVKETRQAAPTTRIVLVGLPGSGSGVPPPGAEPDATLPRPFRIAQFEQALAPAEGAAPPTPAAGD